ncbi:OmpH family outer membrane protein [Loktanella sp. D2R18]|uniref:OmpH family outer membrane protein n=1 Tax=Rhodobacterales TaxID=204455 RepID=UPI000DE97F9D|nr:MULTISPECIES: OmpH family outer membrane protein [Rhodobacterales]MDO6589570.1 OmpH family outer membrane protein [Yoonia sp. 1_MG-2023]RBW44211.1 OmpH family outer membrane protein [Loktanella sp. D2R18]
MSLWRALLICLCAALPARGQEVTPQILVFDMNRIYFETLYGRRIAEDLNQAALAVQDENEQIVATLTEEERSLTLRRPEMTPEDFRAEADAFDAKVQEVRRVRDAKNVELQAADAEQRATFEDRVQGIIANVMLERGAVIVLEQRSVVMSVRAANITDDVIVRVDAELGDGTQ